VSKKQTVTRTQEEILDRFKAATDAFGWEREALVPYLDWEHVHPLLKEDVDEVEWRSLTGDQDDIAGAIREYYALAFSRIEDRDRISGPRSVMKLTALAWLAGRDDVLAVMDEADQAAAKIRAFGAAFGLDGS
jgi:hypothetical protein